MKHNTSYIRPSPKKMPAKQLVVDADGPNEQRYTFFESIEIRRRREGRPEPGVVFVDDSAVSARHCVISQMRDGRCFVRDMSRNGTRLDGRRLIPNVEGEMRVGQVLSVGDQTLFRLEEDPSAVPSRPAAKREVVTGTLEYVERPTVTVLVGDIRAYTALVQEAPPTELQASVSRLFERLDREVVCYGGTVKEHQGDALFAFWEKGEGTESHAAAACRAALGLNRLVEELAGDRRVWALEDFPLRMDWALATGPVAIHSFG
ncbi:MAG: FHA domain-containing protein, partial [Planctomycetota bacterium]